MFIFICDKVNFTTGYLPNSSQSISTYRNSSPLHIDIQKVIQSKYLSMFDVNSQLKTISLTIKF